MANQAYFIDSYVLNADQLLLGLPEDTLVFTLNAQEDGLTQMAQALGRITGLDAIHVIPHGDVWQLQLGSSLVDQAGLDASAGILATIGQSLAEQADLMLYGCNVAQGQIGQAFSMRLAELTGADVAASVDTTSVDSSQGNVARESTSPPVTTDGMQLDSLQALAISPDITVVEPGGVISHQQAVTFLVDNRPVSDLAGATYTVPLWDQSFPSLTTQAISPGGSVVVNQFELGTSAAIQLNATQGNWGVDYSVDTDIRLPGNIRPGDAFVIDTNLLSVANPTFKLTGPSISVDLTLQYNAAINAELIDFAGLGINSTFELASLDSLSLFSRPAGSTGSISGDGSPVSVGWNLNPAAFDSEFIFANPSHSLIDINAVAVKDDPILQAVLDIDDSIPYPGFSTLDFDGKFDGGGHQL